MTKYTEVVPPQGDSESWQSGMNNRDGKTLLLDDYYPGVRKDKLKKIGAFVAAIALVAGAFGLNYYDQSYIKTTCVEANANGGPFTVGEQKEITDELSLPSGNLSDAELAQTGFVVLSNFMIQLD